MDIAIKPSTKKKMDRKRKKNNAVHEALIGPPCVYTF